MSVSFSIKFPIEPFKIIGDTSEIILIGSCFTEHIGNKLNDAGFKTNINPSGILFNPISITNTIKRIAGNEVYHKSDLYKIPEGRFVSFDHHGRFSGNDEDKVIEEINESLRQAYQSLRSADCMIITLGSAWVYRHLKQNRIVANCHKVPNNEFKKELLEIETIEDSIQLAISGIRAINPDIKIIFTISPVKHLRDGVVENQRSKASLILAIDRILKQKDDKIFYFPAYEIVNDELRDYRFFEADHAHPNQLAIDYVWQRFTETCFTQKAIEKMMESENLNKAFKHKTLHSESLNETLQQRIKNYLEKYSLK